MDVRISYINWIGIVILFFFKVPIESSPEVLSEEDENFIRWFSNDQLIDKLCKSAAGN